MVQEERSSNSNQGVCSRLPYPVSQSISVVSNVTNRDYENELTLLDMGGIEMLTRAEGGI